MGKRLCFLAAVYPSGCLCVSSITRKVSNDFRETLSDCGCIVVDHSHFGFLMHDISHDE